MNSLLIFQIAYVIILLIVCLRIIYDTRSHSKTLAYLLFAIFVPVIGIGFYFAFGINLRKRKLYSKKLVQNHALARKLQEGALHYNDRTLHKGDPELKNYKELALMLVNDNMSPVTTGNDVKVLVNGESKFPDMLDALRAAKHHIHIEYYIYADDETGGQIAEVLIQKAKEGVIVRFMYDDFGSYWLRKKMVKRLKEAGINIFPFYRINFIAFANRLNYRNHRKIVVVDGSVAFVGGINVSDKYVNNAKKQKLFWRDTHLRIEGPGVRYLQYLFLCDWGFCSKEIVKPDDALFPDPASLHVKGNKVVQIASSGPDSDIPTILYSVLQGINLAEEELLITTPYFIPGDSIKDALMSAALGDVIVKLLVPGESDSKLVNAAAKSHYADLLNAGVEIYQYKKGFVHAKTIVIDRKVAVVGSANMDYRSFDLNFEVNAIVYDSKIATELAEVFEKDLKDAKRINAKAWHNRPIHVQLAQKTAGLLSLFCNSLNHNTHVFQNTNITFSVLFATSLTAQGAWVFDDAHSNLQFSVTNLMIAEIEGSMKITEASLLVPGSDFTNAVIDIKADIASIDTDNDGRDEHLRSPDFFDAVQYPVLTFKSSEFKKVSENKYLATGDLTFHGITKTVTMDVNASTNVRPYDQKNVVGFKANGVIKRTDFDIAADTPSAILGDEVTIRANVIFVQE